MNLVIERFYSEQKPIQAVTANGDIVQAERSLNAVEKAFQPLEKSPYADKVVVVVDRQNNAGALQNFKNHHKALCASGRFIELPVGSLEEYYPAAWARTAIQVATMDGHKKGQLAKKAGREIDQAAFEAGMPVIYSALTRAWQEAF